MYIYIYISLFEEKQMLELLDSGIDLKLKLLDSSMACSFYRADKPFEHP